MIPRLLWTLWTSPFSWCPGDFEVSVFLTFSSSKLSWCFLYLLIPKPVVLLPWNAAAAAVATKLVNCLCQMTLRTAISRLLRASCARRGQLPITAKTTVILCHHWYPTMHSALPKPVMCSLIHAILSQASECLEQGQKTEWQTQGWPQNQNVSVMFLFLGRSYQLFRHIWNWRQNEAHPSCSLVTFGRNTEMILQQ